MHGPMRRRLDEFLSYLRHVRNYSPETLRAYRSDLSQFIEFIVAGGGGGSRGPSPTRVASRRRSSAPTWLACMNGRRNDPR